MPKVKRHKTVLATKQTFTKPQKAPKRKETKHTYAYNSQPQRRLPAAWKCASIIDQQSAEALTKLLAAAETRTAGASIKSLTLAPHIVHKKPTFAVTVETLKHLPLLKAVVERVGLLQANEQQGFRSKGPAEQAIAAQQDAMQSALQVLLNEADASNAAAWLQQQQQQPQQQQQQQMTPHPRYARVNTLKASVADVRHQLQQQAAARPAQGTGKRQRCLQEPVVDELLPDVLVFPPGTDLHDHPLVQEGVLILQSKASCMPAHALQPQPGWHVVDCCAAPGNKTTHVAALLAASNSSSATHNSNLSISKKQKAEKPGRKRSRLQAEGAPAGADDAVRVFAFDKDPKRLRRLQANVALTGSGHIIVPQQADFLSLDPTAPEFKQVQGVILDPSCSGSGTVVTRMDHLLPQAAAGQVAEEDMNQQGGDAAGAGSSMSAERQRVEQLAKFQESAVLHALKFPALQRLVYSTCSIHQRENEDVVTAVLPTAEAAGFRLVDPFPSWHRRGLPVVPGAEKLVRTDPYKDGTDGFFVAVFEREL